MCEFGKRGGDIAKDFAIDMLFEYEEDDGSTLMSCQGKAVDFIRESKEKHVFVNRMAAMGAHERPLFEKLLWGLLSSTIFVRC